jgi:uncharacterized GH25 family protein
MKYALTTMLAFAASVAQAHEVALPHSHETTNPLVVAAIATVAFTAIVLVALRNKNDV